MGERRGLRYIWRTVPRAPAALFSEVRDVHPAMVQVMYTRGLEAADLCEDFLAGVCRDADDPHLLKDVPKAVARLVQARQRGEEVAVFTDYDADGVNSAAVLATGLRMVGIEPRVRLPNRFVDGYGLTPPIVEELAAAGANVIVTADCGSTAHAAADLARKLGVDLIITDHHQCPPELPRAFALVNPWRPDCGYPCDYLCGAGVAFKLVQALADALLPDGRAAMEPLLDLVAVATVADIMPLLGENRRLVLAGLNIMNAFPRPGVRALIETSGLKPGEVDAAALCFRLAPRVNAAGRLDDPNIAYRLLMSESDERPIGLQTGREEGGILRSRLLGQQANVSLNTGALENLDAAARVEIGIADGSHDAPHTRRTDRVDAWGRFAVMRAWLQRDDECRAARLVAGCVKRLDFRMRSAEFRVPAFRDNVITVQDHGTDQRIRRHPSPPAPRELEPAAHRVALAISLQSAPLATRLSRRGSRRSPTSAPARAGRLERGLRRHRAPRQQSSRSRD